MGPLEGKRIIEIGGLGPGPFCGMMLADMGAEVILVERREDAGTAPESAANSTYMTLNRGKKSIALDLKQADATDIVLRLVKDADGLIEGFRPGVMERLGLGPEVCLEANPGLVYGRITGWGQHGPLSQAAGHDLNYIALSGALHYGGRSDAPPSAPPTIVGDIGGGAMVLAIGMLGAMINAQSTGRGQVIDAAITDGSALETAIMYAMYEAGHWNGARQSNLLDGATHWYDCYECADGKYVSVGAIEPRFYALLLKKLGLEDDEDFARQYDADSWPGLKKRFVEIFKSRPRKDWCELLEGSDACFAPVLDFDEAPQHPHNMERGTFTSIAGVTQPAPAPRFSKTPSEISGPPPSNGQDTDDVLRVAGYSDDDLAAFRERAVIGP